MACVWNCGDETENHSHYAVLVRENSGKLLGRLCPDGTTTNRNIFAAILSKATAEEVAEEITNAGDYKAKAIKF